ncbi:MAG: chemotaxis-specific protein-glutamate methyltransferase CheB [Spirochaetales bacterium]|nr:chemotaxis-specific protein-glutamate methyltransferase CheB [Spirochaetales bacterium]
MADIRLLIVDDSNIVQLVLEKTIQNEEGIEIIGQAYNGAEGVEMAKKLSPDVIVMDINMPEMDGLEAIQEIMSERPTPIIVFSSASKDIVDLSFKSIEFGAVDIIEKPYSESLDSLKQKIEEKLIRTIRTFADFKVIRRLKQSSLSVLAEKTKKLKDVSNRLKKKHLEFQSETTLEEKPFDGVLEQMNEIKLSPVRSSFPVIGVAASTGGPQTIRKFIEDIHFKDIYAGIVIVQHMAEGFIRGFCDWLKEYSPVPVEIAQTGQAIEPCHIYIAPGEYHLGFTPDGKFKYIHEPPILGIRPSADIMFKWIAQSYKKRLIAIILTGMGNDGTEGLYIVKENGGYIIAQDESSSILFGMPKAAIETGIVDKILPLPGIAEFLVTYCKEAVNDD